MTQDVSIVFSTVKHKNLKTSASS